MAYQSNNSNNNQQQNTIKFSSAVCLNIFNNLSGAMKLGFSSANFGRTYATFNISAVFTDMRGKNPKKGEQTYDHENALYFRLNAEDVHVLKTVLNAIESGKAKDFELTFRDTVVRFVEGSMLEEPEYKNGVILYAGKKTEGSEFSFSHSFFFAADTINGYNVNEEGKDVEIPFTINPSFAAFKSYINSMCEYLTAPVDYSVWSNNSSSGTSQNNSGTATPNAPSRRSSSESAAQNWAGSSRRGAEQQANVEGQEGDGELPF